jgi:class 3 adenylate cyclase
VMDAAGIERANLFGFTHGGPLALFFAATFPDRVDRLVLFCSYARLADAPDYPIGIDAASLEAVVQFMSSGRPGRHRPWAPSADDAFHDRWDQLSEDSGGSPARNEHMVRRAWASDVRPILSAVSAPTLVLHRTEARGPTAEMSRYVAEHLSHAAYRELSGSDLFPFVGDSDAVVAAIQEFLTGERSAPNPDRVLLTVLFTDIVDSTKRAAELGDRRWCELLDDHDAMVARQLDRFRGKSVKSTGDGFLATFDGPARAIRCACAIRDGARRLGLEIRAGLHTGECEIRGDDLAGIAVHIGARIGSLAKAGEVLVSSPIPPLIAGSGIEFADRGAHELKGVPGLWHIYAVAD